MNVSGEAVAPPGAPLRHRGPAPSWWSCTTSSTCRSAGCKVKVGGGLAGHNGLRSIKAHLHTDDFVRVRIGVGKPPVEGAGRRPRAQAARARPSAASSTSPCEEAADAVELILAEGVRGGHEPLQRHLMYP